MAFQVFQVGPELDVNEFTDGNQQLPAIAELANGGWVVTWQSTPTQDTSTLDIYQRVYDDEGVLIGETETVVNETTLSAQQQPQVAALANGGWVVTWASDGQDGSSLGVYQRRYEADGKSAGGEILVNATTASQQQIPQVAALADGGWVVTWTSNLQDGSGSGVYQRRYDALGNPSGPDDVLVNSFTLGDQLYSSITALADKPADPNDGGWIVTWVSVGQEGNGPNGGVFQQRFDALGQPMGSETQVNAYIDGNQWVPSVAALADGGWVVAWQSSGADGDAEGVVMRRYDGTGATAGPDIVVSGTTVGLQEQPVVAALANGGWVVTWASALQDGSGYGVYQRRYDSTGATVGSDIRVNEFTNGNQMEPAVTDLTDGGWVVAWQSAGQDGSGSGIYLRRYALTGTNALTLGQDLAIGTDADEILNGDSTTLTKGDVIDGGGGFDTLDLVGAGFDLSSATITGIESITVDNQVGVTAGSTDKNLAMITEVVSAANSSNDMFILQGGGVFTIAERNTLFKNGFDVVVDAESPALTGYVSLAPTAITLSTATVSEATPAGGTVALIGAIDPNAWDTAFDFTLLEPSGLFAVEGNALKLAPGASLDFETLGPAKFTLKLRVTDPGGKTFDQQVTLTLTDANEPPPAPLLSASAVKELSLDETQIGLLQAADPDAGDLVSFMLLDDADGRFALSENQLVVAKGVRLDYEQARFHKVTVAATSNGELSATQTFTIAVVNVTPERTKGSDDPDVIIGGSGKDSLAGGKGNDRLDGGLASDQLSGNAGRDIFVFSKKLGTSNVDLLRDFSARDDTIWIDNAVFKKAGAGTLARPKKLSSDAFFNGKTAQDAQDRILYDKGTGSLFYDSDGTGAAKAVKFAVITTKAALTYNDFFVI